MDNCKKFSDLTVRLQELFKSASYSESTVKDMDFILRAFTSYMNANGICLLYTSPSPRDTR